MTSCAGATPACWLGNTPGHVYHELWQALYTHGHWQGELWDRRKDGAVYPKWDQYFRAAQCPRRNHPYLGLFTDITERKHAEARIEHPAHHDKLTGLFNRHSLQERLGQALASAAYANTRLAVLFIDLTASKSSTTPWPPHRRPTAGGSRQPPAPGGPRHDIVARLGGDEFVVVLASDESAREALPIACQMLAALARPICWTATNRTHPSIGISVTPTTATAWTP